VHPPNPISPAGVSFPPIRLSPLLASAETSARTAAEDEEEEKEAAIPTRPRQPNEPRILEGREITLCSGFSHRVQFARHRHAEAEMAVFFEPAHGVITTFRETASPVQTHLSGRTIWCTAPMVQHACLWEEPAELMLIYLDPAFLERAGTKRWLDVLKRGQGLAGIHDPILWQLASVLRAICREKDQPDLLLMEAVAGAFANRLLAVNSDQPPKSSRKALSAVQLHEIDDFIQQHISTPIRVADLARVVGLSASHFAECFTAAVGVPPAEYVRQRRLFKAHEQILSRKFSLGEVVEATGFCDQPVPPGS
jgi:AraC-like DNA-binding protein